MVWLIALSSNYKSLVDLFKGRGCGQSPLFSAKLNYESCMANSQPVQNGETRTDTVKKAH